MTTLEAARQGIVTELMKQAAASEGIDPELLRQNIAAGTAIVCRNRKRKNGVPLAVGAGTRTKVNANIGTSKDDTSIDKELEKARVAVAAGADLPLVVGRVFPGIPDLNALLENPRHVAEMTELGWTDAESAARIAEAWRRWAEQPASWYALARCETVGRKGSA